MALTHGRQWTRVEVQLKRGGANALTERFNVPLSELKNAANGKLGF